MTTDEWAELAGLLLLAWAAGYGMGLVVLYVRKFMEQI